MKAIDRIGSAFLRRILRRMKELGVSPTEEDILTLAHNCYLAVGGKLGSAMALDEADMANIYRMANA